MNDSFLGESSALDSKSKHQLTNIHPLVPRMGQMLYPTFPILVKTFVVVVVGFSMVQPLSYMSSVWNEGSLLQSCFQAQSKITRTKDLRTYRGCFKTISTGWAVLIMTNKLHVLNQLSTYRSPEEQAREFRIWCSIFFYLNLWKCVSF